MAVDLGLARTGVAVSDAGESFAFPKGVIAERNTDRLVTKICSAAKELSAELIVAGLPRNMDGSEGYRAEECTVIAGRIESESGIPVVMRDERCTTVSAHTLLDYNEKHGKKRKAVIDAVAAVLILEDYLSYRRNTGEK